MAAEKHGNVKNSKKYEDLRRKGIDREARSEEPLVERERLSWHLDQAWVPMYIAWVATLDLDTIKDTGAYPAARAFVRRRMFDRCLCPDWSFLRGGDA